MSIDDGGPTPIDRLRSHLDDDLVCRKCGYDDSDGQWQAKSAGDRVQYRHVCPGCGAIRVRELRLD